eukprot:COSAG01_NODE_3339_length_6232_cov_10.685309_2_plen_37_part_00
MLLLKFHNGPYVTDFARPEAERCMGLCSQPSAIAQV